MTTQNRILALSVPLFGLAAHFSLNSGLTDVGLMLAGIAGMFLGLLLCEILDGQPR